MSLNRYKPHILIWYEDDAYRQIVNGFIKNPALNYRAINVPHEPFGGWRNVADELDNLDIYKMSRYTQRHLLLLVDYDNNVGRLNYIQNKIPENLSDRIFILGVLSESEELKRNIRKDFEKIGMALAQDCADNTRSMWAHDLLKHNESELDRMVSLVRPFLFN